MRQRILTKNYSQAFRRLITISLFAAHAHALRIACRESWNPDMATHSVRRPLGPELEKTEKMSWNWHISLVNIMIVRFKHRTFCDLASASLCVVAQFKWNCFEQYLLCQLTTKQEAKIGIKNKFQSTANKSDERVRMRLLLSSNSLHC